MGTLIGLPGISGKKLEAVFIDDDYKNIRQIILDGNAATDAGDNGAINIWKDDNGRIRCEALQYLRTVESKSYKSIRSAINWAKRWKQKIN
jgi:hypothetical protein